MKLTAVAIVATAALIVAGCSGPSANGGSVGGGGSSSGRPSSVSGPSGASRTPTDPSTSSAGAAALDPESATEAYAAFDAAASSALSMALGSQHDPSKVSSAFVGAAQASALYRGERAKKLDDADGSPPR